MARYFMLLGLTALGCGSSPATPPQPTDPAKTQIVLENHVTWPYRVERAAIVIDGRLESLTTDVPDRGNARKLGEVVLTPGRHTLALVVDAAYPDAMIGGGCAMRARRVVPISIDAAPATLVVDLYSRDRIARFQDRLDVAVTTRGSARAAPPPSQLAPPPPSPACEHAEGAAEGALCRIESRLASANDAGDSAWASCLEEKRTKLRALAEMLERRQTLANEAPEPLLRDHHQAVVGMVHARIARTAGEIERCADAAVELARALDRDVPRGVCADAWPLELEPRGASLDPR